MKVRHRYSAEVLRGRITWPGQDRLGIGDGHVPNGIDEDGSRLRHRLFSRVVQGGYELIRQLALAYHPQRFFHRLQSLRHWDADLEVRQETSIMAKLGHGLLNALVERLFQPFNQLLLRQMDSSPGA